MYIFCPWILQRGAVVILRRAWADGVAGTGDIPTIEFGYFEAPGSDQPLFALLLLPQGGFSPEVNIIISGNCRVLLEPLSRLILIWLGPSMKKNEKKKKTYLVGWQDNSREWCIRRPNVTQTRILRKKLVCPCPVAFLWSSLSNRNRP